MSRRATATLAAVVPTARVAHPGLVVLTVALASVPTALTVASGGDTYVAQLILLGLVTGAALGWAVDDPSSELLASVPSGAPVRAGIRVGAASLLAGATLAAVLTALAIGPGLPADVGDRLPEGAAAAAAALAVGLVSARRGEPAAGAVAVMAGLAGPTLVAGLSLKVHLLPAFTGGAHHGRWWLIAGAALVVALHAGRDPGRR